MITTTELQQTSLYSRSHEKKCNQFLGRRVIITVRVLVGGKRGEGSRGAWDEKLWREETHLSVLFQRGDKKQEAVYAAVMQCGHNGWKTSFYRHFASPAPVQCWQITFTQLQLAFYHWGNADTYFVGITDMISFLCLFSNTLCPWL